MEMALVNEDTDDDNDGDLDSIDEVNIYAGGDNSPRCDYTNADFKITVNYEGATQLDGYSVVGTVPGADGILGKSNSRIPPSGIG